MVEIFHEKYLLYCKLFAGNFYWPYLVIMITPALRLMLVGHWGQIVKDTVRQLI